MEVSERTREIVDSMSMPELLIEFHKQNQSRFQNEGFAYLKTRIDLLNAQEEASHKQKTIEIAEHANTIANNANAIATQALTTSKNSYRMAILAVVISLVAIVAQYFSK